MENNSNYLHVEDENFKEPEAELTTASAGDTFVEPEKEKSIEQITQELLQNEEVRNNCLFNAKDFKKQMNDDWFTVDKLVRKTNIKDIKIATDLLDILCLFSMCYRKVVEGRITRYKIVLSDEQKLPLLYQELAEAKATVGRIESQINLIISNNAS